MSSIKPQPVLATLINLTVKYDQEAENARIHLAKDKNFDIFYFYRIIDRSKNGFINQSDFSIFLQSHRVFIEESIRDKFFRRGKDDILKITYNDFIAQLLPITDIDLKNKCMSRIGEKSMEVTPNSMKDVEAKMAIIYKKEAELIKMTQEIKDNSPEIINLKEILYSLCDENTGFLSYKKLKDFLEENSFELTQQGFDYLIRRISLNKTNKITPADLSSHLFPKKPLQEITTTQETYSSDFFAKSFTITQRAASASKFFAQLSPNASNIKKPSNLSETYPMKSLHLQELETTTPHGKPLNFSTSFFQSPIAKNFNATSLLQSPKDTNQSYRNQSSPPQDKLAASSNLRNNNFDQITTDDLEPETGKFFQPNKQLAPPQARFESQNQQPYSSSLAKQTHTYQNDQIYETEKKGYYDEKSNRQAESNKYQTSNYQSGSALKSSQVGTSHPRADQAGSYMNRYSAAKASGYLDNNLTKDYDYRQGFYSNPNGTPSTPSITPYTARNNQLLKSSASMRQINVTPINTNINTYSPDDSALRFYSPKYSKSNYSQPYQSTTVSNPYSYKGNISSQEAKEKNTGRVSYTKTLNYQQSPYQSSLGYRGETVKSQPALKYNVEPHISNAGTNISYVAPTAKERTLDFYRSYTKENNLTNEKRRDSYKFGNNNYDKLWEANTQS